MRAVQARGLFLDALHQVLDNKVFRILACVSLLPALFTCLVSFREEGLVVLFGWQRVDYDSMLPMLAGTADTKGVVIEGLLQIVLEGLTGNLGMLVCLVATAFFVPNAIEKGTADLLFHKPVSRFAIYLSRYVAGLLFVAFLTLVTTAGMWLGLAVFSGHNDPGILCSAVTLTYGFALLYPVSMLFGLLLRNAIGALMLTFVFMWGNGCIVHEGWIFKEYWLHAEREAFEREATGEEQPADAATGDEVTDEEQPAGAVAEDGAAGRSFDPWRGVNPWLRLAARTADVLHYPLPKTDDAVFIGRELRRQVSSLPYRDPETELTFYSLPRGSERVPPAEVEVPEAAAPWLGPAVFAFRTEGGARVSLHRRERRKEDGELRPESRNDAGRALEAALEGAGASDLERTTGNLGNNGRGRSAYATTLRWTDGGEPRVASVFLAGDWFHTLWVALPEGLDEDARKTLVADVDGSFALPGSPAGRGFGLEARTRWYEETVGFGAPLRFNLWFSIATSLAFVAATLALGGWRLARMDF